MLTEENKKTVFKSLKKELKENSRSISRSTFLAFAFIRGRKYREVEHHTHWDFVEGYRPGALAGNLLSHGIVFTIIKQIYPKFVNFYSYDPNFFDDETKEIIKEIYKSLMEELKAWFLEGSDEVVSRGR